MSRSAPIHVPSGSSGIARHSRQAERLWLTSTVVLALVPVAMALSNRSSQLMLVLAALAALGAAHAEGRLDRVLRETARVAATPLGCAVAAFVAWAAVSIVWSPFPATSLHALGEFLLSLAAAAVLATTLPGRMPRRAVLLLVAGVAIACLIILIDQWTLLAARYALGMRALFFIYNRPVLTLLVLAIPLLWLTWPSRRRWWGLAGAILAGVTVLRSESGAAVLGLFAGSAAWILATVSRRMAAVAVAATIAAAFIVAPLTGTLVDRAMPAWARERLVTSARERLDIWKGYQGAIRQQPLLGAGFGVGPRFFQTAAAERLTPEERAPLAIGHPHSAAMQIWVELGAIGAAFAMLVLWLLLRCLMRLPKTVQPPAIALLAAVAAVSLVGHGAWQGWWPAAIGAAIVWLRHGLEPSPEHAT